MSDQEQDQLERAERFQRMFVLPIVEAMRIELRSHTDQLDQKLTAIVTQVKDHDDRLVGLEKNQKKALIGWGVLTLAVGTFTSAAYAYIKSKIHIG